MCHLVHRRYAILDSLLGTETLYYAHIAVHRKLFFAVWWLNRLLTNLDGHVVCAVELDLVARKLYSC